MRPFTTRQLICATLLCLANLAHAQGSSSVTPPMRADVRFSGTDAGGRGVSTLAACHDKCKSTPGCSGFSFWAGWDATKPSCLLFAGSLTEAAQAKWVSCRMPCTPGPRASVLPQRLAGRHPARPGGADAVGAGAADAAATTTTATTTVGPEEVDGSAGIATPTVKPEQTPCRSHSRSRRGCR